MHLAILVVVKTVHLVNQLRAAVTQIMFSCFLKEKTSLFLNKKQVVLVMKDFYRNIFSV